MEERPHIKRYTLDLTLKPDYTYFVYPFHVLSTNRILNTVISRYERKGTIRAHKDLADIYKLTGVKGLFYGLVPYTVNHLFNNLQIFGSSDDEFSHPTGKYWFAFTLLMWNPLNI